MSIYALKEKARASAYKNGHTLSYFICGQTQRNIFTSLCVDCQRSVFIEDRGIFGHTIRGLALIERCDIIGVQCPKCQIYAHHLVRYHGEEICEECRELARHTEKFISRRKSGEFLRPTMFPMQKKIGEGSK